MELKNPSFRGIFLDQQPLDLNFFVTQILTFTIYIYISAINRTFKYIFYPPWDPLKLGKLTKVSQLDSGRLRETNIRVPQFPGRRLFLTSDCCCKLEIPDIGHQVVSREQIS